MAKITPPAQPPPDTEQPAIDLSALRATVSKLFTAAEKGSQLAAKSEAEIALEIYVHHEENPATNRGDYALMLNEIIAEQTGIPVALLISANVTVKESDTPEIAKAKRAKAKLLAADKTLLGRVEVQCVRRSNLLTCAYPKDEPQQKEVAKYIIEKRKKDEAPQWLEWQGRARKTQKNKAPKTPKELLTRDNIKARFEQWCLAAAAELPFPLTGEDGKTEMPLNDKLDEILTMIGEPDDNEESAIAQIRKTRDI